MDGTRAVCFALLAVAGLGAGCSGKKSEPSSSKEAPPASSPQATGARDAGAAMASPADAAPTDEATAPPDPVTSLFRRHYKPDDSLSERMQRRIRYHLRYQTKAPIAIHHITRIPHANPGGDVFAIFEYSVYEDCVLGYEDRQEGREKCASELATISDLDGHGRDRFGQEVYPDKEVRLNSECVAIGVVRAHFESSAPGIPDDVGGALTVRAVKLADGLCEVRGYDRLFIADLDGDEKPEMFIDVTTSQEKVNENPGLRASPGTTTIGHRFERHLYLFAGDDANGIALSIELGSWEDYQPPPQELVELRDVNRDRRLDVIRKELCFDDSRGMSADRCNGRPRQQTAYLYDAKKDAWAPQDAKEPASDAAKEHEKEHAKGSAAKEPASGAAAPP